MYEYAFFPDSLNDFESDRRAEGTRTDVLYYDTFFLPAQEPAVLWPENFRENRTEAAGGA